MKHITIYELMWLFFIYSFMGWVLETVTAVFKQRKFVNRGLINGPFCVLYGITSVLMTIGLRDLRGIWLFLFALVYATVAEWVGGHLIEKFFKERWWDYSKIKWNLDGYICVPASLLWGVLGYLVIRWGNRWNLMVLSLLPDLLTKVLLLIFFGILIIDILASVILLTGKSRNPQPWIATDQCLDKVNAGMRKCITGWVERRIHRAYPKAKKLDNTSTQKNTIFAPDGSFYQIVFLFVIGSFLGDIIETIFCFATTGIWMSRSSVIWGPFSIVWGLAIGCVTALMYKYKDRSDAFLFIMGTLLGGSYEYLCSVFTEIFFGKIFWDYSKIPFNLGGRINLLFCFFWGIAAVVWFKRLYPHIARWIAKIPVKPGKVITWIMLIFMCCNILASSVALVRYDERGKGIVAESAWQHWADRHYNDEKMEKIYPNAKVVISMAIPKISPRQL